jgi:hypothetical protein
VTLEESELFVNCIIVYLTSNDEYLIFKNLFIAGLQWLTPIILATQEVEIRRIEV